MIFKVGVTFLKKTTKTIIAGTVGAAGLFLASTVNANADTTVKVAKNDTVWGIAQKYNVSIKSIETLNNISQNTHLILENQTLQVPTSSTDDSDSSSKTSVTVKDGDTLWNLANEYGISVEKLQSLNNLNGDLIKPGQKLTVSGSATKTSEQTASTASTNHVTYTVKEGDSLYTIAQAYGVTVESLKSSNDVGSVIVPGQTLTVNDPTKTPAATATAATTDDDASTTTANAAASTTTAATTTTTSASADSTSTTAATSATATTTQAAAASSATTSSSATTAAKTSSQTATPVASSTASSTVATAKSTTTTSSSTATATTAAASSTQKVASSTTTTSVSGSAVVSYAEQFLGIPYAYGGTTPNGFDCSGFTQYVYRHFGVSLPRTAAAQSTIGTAVSVSSAQVGDLLFWGSQGSSWHVGIYVGGTSYIAAPKTGESVSVKSFQYFKPSFAIHMN
jgi:cell wall-associated NlpC family hydrolase